MSAPVIDVRGLNKRFGAIHAVKDFGITLEAGRICGFLGPNGAGKTTTLRMLCGLLTPDSGAGTVLGLDVLAQSQAIKRRVGYMTQRFSLYEDLSIEQNLEFTARVHELDRRRELVDAALARLGLETRRRQLAAIRQRREVGTLGAREDAVAAAEAQAAQAAGGLVEVRTRMQDLAPKAPVEARVEEVFYRPGEWAAANQPVVSLQPDGEVKLRFFVPEREVARYRPGRTVRFSCDGCGGSRRATITWVSRRPEFTPPVIYSRDNRDRLVFLVEARPENPRELNPGLPVDVAPLSGRS